MSILHGLALSLLAADASGECLIVTSCCTDVAGQPSVKSYHDSAAQASFATKAVFLIDGIVPLLSHWAFSDIFEEQVRPRQASRHGTHCVRP